MVTPSTEAMRAAYPVKTTRRVAMMRQRKMKATMPIARHVLIVSVRSWGGQPFSPWTQ